MVIPKLRAKRSRYGVYAVCRLSVDGKKKDFYLGKYDDPEAERRYRQLINSYLADDVLTPPEGDELTMSYIYNRYLDTLEGVNRSDVNNAKRCLRYALECFGEGLKVSDFSDETKTIRVLTTYQQYLLSIAKETRTEPTGKVYGVQSAKAGQPVYKVVKRPWTYTGINRIVKNWIAILRWACRQGLLPFAIYRVLDALKPLNARSGLQRSPEAQAVDDDVLLAVMPYMTPTVREMVQIQRGTGMRAKEVCDLLVGDIDKTGDQWRVKTDRHKTSAHLRYRYFAFSIAETEILRRRCEGKSDDQHVFSQRENFTEFWDANQASRKSPMYKKERRTRQRTAKTRLNRIHDYFTERSYAQSIRTAVNRAKKAGVDVGTIAPKSIRHAAYTEYSAKYGVELASKNAGHTSPRMADVYDHSLRMAAEKLASERGLFGADGA